MPNIIKIERDLTKLLRNKKGAVFCSTVYIQSQCCKSTVVLVCHCQNARSSEITERLPWRSQNFLEACSRNKRVRIATET